MDEHLRARAVAAQQRSRALREDLHRTAGSLARTEQDTSRVHDELAATSPEHAERARREGTAARQVADALCAGDLSA